ILDGATLLKEKGIDRILIHTDNLEVVQAIKKETSSNPISTLIAKMASANMEGVNVLTTIPKEVLEVLNNDKASDFLI
ncbi:hypothetical protein Godav_023336, partial [Gossypium davidsonii]|nr:hypothetical protein [Gossypium davidsonii]